MALAVAPFAAQAETWNIYGWQNHSWEFIDVEGGRSYDRTQSNAGNIGFAGSVDTGMNGIHVNVQCEQFTFYNHFGGFGDWCNRNSKIGLSHPQMGEIMIATWLLPYNEGVAQWVDPFYDAGADSHTSIMGSVGGKTLFYNAGFGFAGGQHLGFNRRQENIIQYWSPNWNGFVFRFAWTVGNQDETAAKRGSGDIDPIIRSSSLAYTNGPFWAAVTWQDHEDWSAVNIGEMQSSDAESIRIAGRYIMDMGDGMSVQISAMYEDLEYEFNNISSMDAVMDAFGLGNFSTSYALNGTSQGRDATDPDYSTFADLSAEAKDNAVKAQKTLALVRDLFYNDNATAGTYALNQGVAAGGWGAVTTLINTVAPADNPLTDADESTASGCASTDPATCADFGLNVLAAPDGTNVLRTAVEALNQARDTDGDVVGIQAPDLSDSTSGSVDQRNAEVQYRMLVAAATANAMDAFEPQVVTPGRNAVPEVTRANVTENRNAKIEREAWMVSGKIKFGGPVDFRFSYMDADDLEVSCGACSGDWNDTAADAWNVGVFYTMPAGTELRLTYSEVDNDTNGSYDFGIGGAGVQTGGSVEMFAVGVVHWFD